MKGFERPCSLLSTQSMPLYLLTQVKMNLIVGAYDLLDAQIELVMGVTFSRLTGVDLVNKLPESAYLTHN